MSTRAKSLEPAATRAIASSDPLAMLVVTARPSELNRPLTPAIRRGAARASTGRSGVNWIAIGCGRSSAAAATPAHATAPSPISKARIQRMALLLITRIGTRPGDEAAVVDVCRSGHDGFMTPQPPNYSAGLV